MLVFGIVIFYSVLLLLMSSYGNSKYQQNIDLGLQAKDSTERSWYTWIPGASYLVLFFRMIGFTIGGIPFWMTAIIFTPLTVLVIWIIAEWIRGSG